MRVYVMVGAPGAGKGTQAALLSERLSLPHISSGDLFRTNIEQGTPVGLEAKRYIDRGALVPDEVTLRMVGERLSEPDAREGAILDGFPRTRPQAEALDVMLGQRSASVTAALYVDVDREEIVERLAGRRVCREAQHVYHLVYQPPRQPGICDIDGSDLYQRPDDRPETIRRRLEEQLAPMFDVVDHYLERGVLSCVEGEAPIAEVGDALLRVVALPAR